eukprot:COSAG02_NODE_41376_length_395_cov_0.858108_1_plen_98_part_10
MRAFLLLVVFVMTTVRSCFFASTVHCAVHCGEDVSRNCQVKCKFVAKRLLVVIVGLLLLVLRRRALLLLPRRLLLLLLLLVLLLLLLPSVSVSVLSQL